MGCGFLCFPKPGLESTMRSLPPVRRDGYPFQKNEQWLDTPMGVHIIWSTRCLTRRMEERTAKRTLPPRGASPNAFTSTAITGYHFECADQFWDNLRTLLEFVSVPYFTKESVDKEQGIIGQEIPHD